MNSIESPPHYFVGSKRSSGEKEVEEREKDDEFVGFLRWFLPCCSAISCLAEAIWSLKEDASSYSGLASTVLVVCFYFAHDSRIAPDTWKYKAYFGCLAMMPAGDFIFGMHAIQANPHHQVNFLSIFYFVWTLVDSAFLVFLYMYRHRLHREARVVPFGTEVIFMLIWRMELVSVVFIPHITNDRHFEPSNVVGFFVFGEVVGHYYHHFTMHIKLLYWMFSACAVLTVLFKQLSHENAEKYDNDEYDSDVNVWEFCYLLFELLAGILTYAFVLKTSILSTTVEQKLKTSIPSTTAEQNLLHPLVRTNTMEVGYV